MKTAGENNMINMIGKAEEILRKIYLLFLGVVFPLYFPGSKYYALGYEKYQLFRLVTLGMLGVSVLLYGIRWYLKPGK